MSVHECTARVMSYSLNHRPLCEADEAGKVIHSNGPDAFVFPCGISRRSYEGQYDTLWRAVAIALGFE